MSRFFKKKQIKNAVKLTGGNPASPQYWVKKLFGHSGDMIIDVNEDSALKYSAVWAAVNIISGAVGFLPLIPYQRFNNGKKRIYDHDIFKIIRRPNPFMDSLTFRQTLQAHVLIWGNGYAEIERNGKGEPVNLWPLLPHLVSPKIKEDRLIYEINSLNQGNVVNLDYTNVLHIHGLGFDGLKGYSPIEYAASNIALGIASEKNATAFFNNDSTPSGLLTTEQPLKKETKELVEKGWEDKHKSLDDKYRIAVLHSGLKYQPIGLSAKDAQLIESRKYGVSDVARWFTIPPHMIGDLEKATFSNIEHQGMAFVTWTLARWLKKWELEINYKLFSTAEQNTHFVEFLEDALLRGDTKTRAESYQIALGGNNNPGYMSVNEVRERENLPDTPGGDVLFRPNYEKTDNKEDVTNLIKTIWDRIITKETKAVQKALKKPDNFLEWVKEFYNKHAIYVMQILSPTTKVCNLYFTTNHIQEHCTRQLQNIERAFENNKTEDELLKWADIPEIMAKSITGV